MSDLRPLAVHPFPVADAHLELLKRAKAALDLPYQVLPSAAVPGSPGRVLAFGSPPPHVCDAVVIDARHTERYEAVAEALRQVLTVPAGAIHVVEETDYLRVMLGAREITHLLPVDFDGNIDAKGPLP